MSIAEIHGKISGAGTNLSERMEDMLTSDVFGCLRYLPAEKALVPFLLTARSFHGVPLRFDAEIVRVHSAFWPRLKSPGRIPCEPDAVLGLETAENLVHLVAIEAKYYAGLSSEEDEREAPNSQLARELDNLNVLSHRSLGWEPSLEVASRVLLFVTEDMSMPRTLLKQSLDEVTRKRKKHGDIFWTSWRFLPSILENSLENECDPCHKAVLEDMLRLLLRKGLVAFHGVEPVVQQFPPSDFEFYRSRSRDYRWPTFPELIDILCEYNYGR